MLHVLTYQPKFSKETIMKKLKIIRAGLFVLFAFISNSTLASYDKLFVCVDASTFEVDSECVAEKIRNSDAFRAAQVKISQQAKEVSDNITAATDRHPQLIQSHIAAHSDNLITKKIVIPNVSDE